MDERIIEQIHDKFMKCPECGYYSVSQSRPSLLQRISRPLRHITAYSCSNCGLTFTLDRHSNLRVAITLCTLSVLTALFVWVIWLRTDVRPAGPTESANLITPPESSAGVTVTEPNSAHPQEEMPGTEATPPPEYAVEEPDEAQVTTLAPQIQEIDPTTDPTPVPEAPEDQPSPESEPDLQETATEPFGYIAFGTQHRFGVNWSVTADGLTITRISSGPMRNGGIRVGDVLLRVNDKPVGNGDELTRLRNEVVDGQRESVSLIVRQGGEEHLFLLVREKP